MIKLKGLLLLLISVMVLNGCIVPQYISYDDVVREGKGEDYFVRIYEDGELEEGDYKAELASRDMDSFERGFRRFREKQNKKLQN